VILEDVVVHVVEHVADGMELRTNKVVCSLMHHIKVIRDLPVEGRGDDASTLRPARPVVTLLLPEPVGVVLSQSAFDLGNNVVNTRLVRPVFYVP